MNNVYLKAAEIAAADRSQFACWAIVTASGGPFSIFFHIPESLAFCDMFQPKHSGCIFFRYEDGNHDVLPEEEQQQRRVLALLFMHWITNE